MKQQPSAWGRPHAPAPPRWGRKILSVFLSVVLCLSMLPATVLAEGTEQTHTHSVGDKSVTFMAWNETSSLPETEGNYYLTKNVTLTKTWEPADGTVLCLNGHSITENAGTADSPVVTIAVGNHLTFTLTDCKGGSDEYGKITHTSGAQGHGVQVNGGIFYMYGGNINGNIKNSGKRGEDYGGGVYMRDGGKFTMYDGSISGNTSRLSGSGVYVNNNGTFTMHGGRITGNTSTGDIGGGVHVEGSAGNLRSKFTMAGGEISGNSAYNNGGGVYVGGKGMFVMTGGRITGNNTSNWCGGGVYVDQDGTFTVSGTAKITENVKGGTLTSTGKYTGTTSDNVYLYSGRTITIGEERLSAGASIGVTTEKTPSDNNIVPIVNGAKRQDMQYFTSDKNYHLVFDNGAIALSQTEMHRHAICGDTCTDGGNHQSESWTGITDLSEIDTVGHYYLKNDIEIANTWTPVDGVYLCLNGHSITENAGTFEDNGQVTTIMVNENTIFTLTDCKGDSDEYGKITHGTNGSNGKYNGHGVEVKGTFYMYGGSIAQNTFFSSGGGVAVYGGGQFTMYGGSITDNNAYHDGGGVYVSGNSNSQKSQFIMNGGIISNNKTEKGIYDGGGVGVSGGSFTMNGGSITGNNTTMSGGGVGVFRGSFTMSGGTITGNGATKGGGVFVSQSTFEMNDGDIYSNSATDNGGGVLVTASGSTFTMTGGTIGGTDATGANTAKKGGGVYVMNNGSFTLNGQGAMIAHNTAIVSGNASTKGKGGGVCADGGTFIMQNGTVCGNETDGNGGGVYVGKWDDKDGHFTMSGGTITGNKAATTQNSDGNGGGVFVNDDTFTVSGAVQITGNVKGSVANNMYLPADKTITIGDTGLSGTARIGVTTANMPAIDNPVKIATGATQDVKYTQIFTPDVTNRNYMVTKKNENGVWNLYLGPHQQHSWTYTANDTTITATCEACDTSGGSVTISALENLTYDGSPKMVTVQMSNDWQGGNVTPTYQVKTGDGENDWGNLPEGTAAPTNAGTYKATIGVGSATASVEYTIAKADPKASDFDITLPHNPIYDNKKHEATVNVKDGITGMGEITAIEYYINANGTVLPISVRPCYEVRINVAEGENYKAANQVTGTDSWRFTIGKANQTITVPTDKTIVKNGIGVDISDWTSVTGVTGGTKTGTLSYALADTYTGVTLENGQLTVADSVAKDTIITIQVTAAATNNYNEATDSFTVKVVDKSKQPLNVSMTGWTYGGTANTPQYTPPEGFTGTPTITYAKKNADGSFTELTTAPTDAGNYKVTVVCETPLVIYSGSAEFSIAKRSSSSSSSPTYSVTTPDKTENGTVTISPKNAKQGSSVTITVTPDAGYVLGDLGVTDRNGKDVTLTKKSDTEYTFVMPAGQVEVKASFVKGDVGQSDFADVKDGDYFYDAVRWAVEKGVTNGTDATHFSPDASCTRAQIVTFLWRAAGSPEPKGLSGFVDVAEGSYYAKAVAWAVEQGITNGTDATHFSPDASCTRAQSVTFLYRALGQKTSSQAAFADVPADSYYADAVAWAAEQGITNGTGNGQFSPNAVCTRAQIVTFLYRAYQGK